MDLITIMKLSKVFITGCDSNTEWMLPWFLDNFRRHSRTEIIIFDFGMTPEAVRVFGPKPLNSQDKGWFKKPKAMIEGSKLADQVCWLDTDCNIQGDIDSIFNYIEPNKLAMVEDVPWSKRRQEKWHNSGVVAFGFKPIILDEWATAVALNPQVGDQEVLHTLVREGFRRDIHITDLPRKFNNLRLDLLDGTNDPNPIVMHWTGAKGKEVIRNMMYE